MLDRNAAMRGAQANKTPAQHMPPHIAISQVSYLTSIGLKADEVCNMASISVVLLGLNPETRLKSVVEYMKSRGVPSKSNA